MDHLGRDVAPVWQKALPDQTPVPVNVQNVAYEGLTGDQAAQRGGGGGAPALIPLRGIESPDTYPAGLATEGEGIAVDNFADPRLKRACLLRLRIGQADEGRRNCECHQQKCHTTQRTREAANEKSSNHFGR